MALSSTILWECRATGSANMVNGGGFKPGASGVDYSQQNSAQYALTGVTSAGTGATFLTASAAADMVGNVCRVRSGTNFTTGWYEIISVVAGVSVTVDRNLTTGVGASGLINIGGALSLNSISDDAFFEAVVGGNIVYVKSGTLSLGVAVSVASTSGTATSPVIIEGYNNTRGDAPTGSNRPTITCAANSFALGQYMYCKNIQFTITTAAGVSLGAGGALVNCKVNNTSTTAGRSAVTCINQSSIHNCEIVCQNGIGLSNTTARVAIIGCYIHDCDIGFQATVSSGITAFTVIESCVTAALNFTGTTGAQTVLNCTLYGSEAKIGTGILLATNVPSCVFYNNIIYGFSTGISQSVAQLASNMGAYNCFNNNTSNASNYTLDPTDISTNPTFTSASQLTGSTATTSGSTLTQSGGDFSSVTDNVDYLRVTSGTGVTTGIYLITSHTSTTVTVNNALGTSSGGDVVWTVPVGHDFSVGTNMRAVAFPGVIPGSETTGFLDMGAAQRLENRTSAYTFVG